MLTYKVWDELLYTYAYVFKEVSIYTITRCLLLSIVTIPIDIIISPIEILAVIIFGIVKLIEKIKE